MKMVATWFFRNGGKAMQAEAHPTSNAYGNNFSISLSFTKILQLKDTLMGTL
jgi:hypothetical protein